MDIETLGYIICALLAIIDRIKETINFLSWYLASILFSIRNDFWHKWWRSYDEDEFRYISIYKAFKLPLHPIFWDGYHSMKNLGFLFFIIFHAVASKSYIPILVDPVIIYGWQQITRYMFIKK